MRSTRDTSPDGPLAQPAGTALTRRSLITSAVAVTTLAAAAQFALPAPAAASPALQKVPATKSPARALFAPNEQIMGPYLMTLAAIANDVSDKNDGTYGYMGGGWFRTAGTQTLQNSRVMENIALLGWFYANQRPWNPYYKNAVLLKRLEAAIGYYTRLQLADGSYQDYQGRSSLAATTFGLATQIEAYEALRKVWAGYDARLQLRKSIERGVSWFMNPKARHWTTPIPYFNQMVAGLVAAQRSLQCLDKPTTTQDAINERTAFLVKHGTSAAGFPHEPFGSDWGYNFMVTMPDVAVLYRATKHPDLLGLVQRYAEHIRYAVVREPDTGRISHVPALNSGGRVADLERPSSEHLDRAAVARDFLPLVPNFGILFATAEEKAQVRADFLASASSIPGLKKPSTDPRTWMHGIQASVDAPTQTVRDAIETGLPSVAQERFVRALRGSKSDEYLFVRRPGFYAVSVFGLYVSGTNSTRQLGTLWNPVMGTVISSTNAEVDGEAWETIGPQASFSTRQSSARTRYLDARNASFNTKLTLEQVPSRSGLFAAQTESTAGASQYITGWGYWDTGLRYTFITQQLGDCTQRIPLVLKSGDVLTFSDGSAFSFGETGRDVTTTSIVLQRGAQRLLFSLGSTPLRVNLSRTGSEIAGGVIHRVSVTFQRSITVNSVFLGDAAAVSLTAEAHKHADGQISMRVTNGAALAGAQVTFGGGVSAGAVVKLPALHDFGVSELTLPAGPAINARSMQSAPGEVTVTAVDASGAILGETRAPII